MKVAIVGTAGIPASYGGFETLAENLVLAAERAPEMELEFTVFCSGGISGAYHGAILMGVPLKANGWQSVIYDVISLWRSRKTDIVLILGVSGAIALPLFRWLSKAKIVTNIDGVEWRRQKWGLIASAFLRLSQEIAVRFSDAIVVDNEGVLSFLRDTKKCVQIEYGGDHALVDPKHSGHNGVSFPERFFLAICRIEPENNVHLILESFSEATASLVFIGNWDGSHYSRTLREKYGGLAHIRLCDPIYDLNVLSYLRSAAIAYVHGHSAGGTNPSLVEAMHFGRPVVAYDCIFNRVTTENLAVYFSSVAELRNFIEDIASSGGGYQGLELARVARRRFTWRRIAQQYFALFNRLVGSGSRGGSFT